jgi:hypothetical protein
MHGEHEYKHHLLRVAMTKDFARRVSRQEGPHSVTGAIEQDAVHVAVSPQSAEGVAAEIASIKAEIMEDEFGRACELQQLKLTLAEAKTRTASYLADDVTGKSGGWYGASAAPWAAGEGRCNIKKMFVGNLSRQAFLEDFVDLGQPVILFGDEAFSGAAKREWTKARFLEEWGAHRVQVSIA